MDTTHDVPQNDMSGMPSQSLMHEGDDFVCPNCSCEIRLVHHGDPARMQRMDMFICCCGTRMEMEHRPS
jgi:hypothetical protein